MIIVHKLGIIDKNYTIVLHEIISARKILTAH